MFENHRAAADGRLFLINSERTILEVNEFTSSLTAPTPPITQQQQQPATTTTI